MNTLFRNNYENKKRKYDTNIQKAMIIYDGIFQTNKKLFVMILPKKHVNRTLLILYGYQLLIKHSQKI